jgi:hypothetical protein
VVAELTVQHLLVEPGVVETALLTVQLVEPVESILGVVAELVGIQQTVLVVLGVLV